MKKDIKNISASVHQRIINEARKLSRPFNELLQRFMIERFLYRLSKSQYTDKLVLKGALMLSVWSGIYSRPTKDIDFLGKVDNDIKQIVGIIKEICQVPIEDDDGLAFNTDTIIGSRITADAKYEGVRVQIQAMLGNNRLSLQIDVGFGDKVTPAPRKIQFPAFLDFLPPELYGYTMESAIAEKLQAMIQLGETNSRMKDFYDLWKLFQLFDFNGNVLSDAVSATFRNRNTALAENPAVFQPAFASQNEKIVQWSAFIRKAELEDAPTQYKDVVSKVKLFAQPLLLSMAKEQVFDEVWIAPGPWREKNDPVIVKI